MLRLLRLLQLPRLLDDMHVLITAAPATANPQPGQPRSAGRQTHRLPVRQAGEWVMRQTWSGGCEGDEAGMRLMVRRVGTEAHVGGGCSMFVCR